MKSVLIALLFQLFLLIVDYCLIPPRKLCGSVPILGREKVSDYSVIVEAEESNFLPNLTPLLHARRSYLLIS